MVETIMAEQMIAMTERNRLKNTHWINITECQYGSCAIISGKEAINKAFAGIGSQ